MKLTKSQLKRIIKEELTYVAESGLTYAQRNIARGGNPGVDVDVDADPPEKEDTGDLAGAGLDTAKGVSTGDVTQLLIRFKNDLLDGGVSNEERLALFRLIRDLAELMEAGVVSGAVNTHMTNLNKSIDQALGAEEPAAALPESRQRKRRRGKR